MMGLLIRGSSSLAADTFASDGAGSRFIAITEAWSC